MCIRDRIAPELLHAQHCRAGGAEVAAAGVIYLVVEGPERLTLNTFSAAYKREQRGICRRTSAKHDRRQTRKTCFKNPRGLSRKDVPVVAERPGAVLREVLRPRGQFVHVPAHAGVNDALGDGEAPVDVQQRGKLRRVLDAEAGLDRNAGHSRLREYAPEKRLQLLRKGQKARALALGGDGAGGAAEVEVHLAVAHVRKQLCRPDEVPRVAAEELRHEGHPFISDGVQFPGRTGRQDVLALSLIHI